MRLPIVLRPEAEADLTATQDWYEHRRSGLGKEFADSFENLLDHIAARPELYATALRNVRRGKLRRFPYVVYYRILRDRIEILAVLHGSRDPRVWKNRA